MRATWVGMGTNFSEHHSFYPESGFPCSPDFNKNISQVPTLKIPFLPRSSPFPSRETQETSRRIEWMGARNAPTPLN